MNFLLWFNRIRIMRTKWLSLLCFRRRSRSIAYFGRRHFSRQCFQIIKFTTVYNFVSERKRKKNWNGKGNIALVGLNECMKMCVVVHKFWKCVDTKVREWIRTPFIAYDMKLSPVTARCYIQPFEYELLVVSLYTFVLTPRLNHGTGKLKTHAWKPRTWWNYHFNWIWLWWILNWHQEILCDLKPVSLHTNC